jgi:catechol 2,3-dioxygenase-like lactoylglutathione lyase family enzyme
MFIWVTDQDEALAFYRDTLGLEVRSDATMDGWRWLTVGAPDQPDLEITLMVPGPPPLDPDVAERVKELVALGAMGGAIFQTDDCRRDHAALRDRGVEFTEEPAERFYGIDAGFRDPFGNPFRLVQPIEFSAQADSPGATNPVS